MNRNDKIKIKGTGECQKLTVNSELVQFTPEDPLLHEVHLLFSTIELRSQVYPHSHLLRLSQVVVDLEGDEDLRFDMFSILQSIRYHCDGDACR